MAKPLRRQSGCQVLAPRFAGLELVALGATDCFALRARTAVRIIRNDTECARLRRRAATASKRSDAAACGSFAKIAPDADVYTWWQSLPGQTNEIVLTHLRRMQREGWVRPNERATYEYVLFDHGYDHDMRLRAQREPGMAWQVNTSFDESCLRDTRHNRRCERSNAAFTVAAFPLGSLPNDRRETRIALNRTFIRELALLDPIPKVVHITWSDTGLLARSKNKMLANGYRMVERLSPGWKVVMWNDTEMARYIRESNELAPADVSLLFRQQQQQICDLFRLLLLHKQGGVYIDLDVLINKNLNDIVFPTTKLILESYQNRDFTQAFQGTAPGNPIFKRAIDLNVERRRHLGLQKHSRTDILHMGPNTYLHAISERLIGRFILPDLHGPAPFSWEVAAVFDQLPMFRPTIVSGHRRSECETMLYNGRLCSRLVPYKNDLYREAGLRYWQDSFLPSSKR